MTELPRELIEYLDREITKCQSWLVDDRPDHRLNEDEVFYLTGYKNALSAVRSRHLRPQPPAKRVSTVRTCKCGKPLLACDTGDVCPACAHRVVSDIVPSLNKARLWSNDEIEY